MEKPVPVHAPVIVRRPVYIVGRPTDNSANTFDRFAEQMSGDLRRLIGVHRSSGQNPRPLRELQRRLVNLRVLAAESIKTCRLDSAGLSKTFSYVVATFWGDPNVYVLVRPRSTGSTPFLLTAGHEQEALDHVRWMADETRPPSSPLH